MKNIAILGSTGSIGTQTLQVVRDNNDIKVHAIAAGHNIKALAEQVREFRPKLVCVAEEKSINELRLLTPDIDYEVYMICWTEWKRKPELKSHPTCYVTILQICESRQDGNWK